MEEWAMARVLEDHVTANLIGAASTTVIAQG